MNPIKELRKKRLSSVQRVVDFILKFLFVLLLFLYISNISINMITQKINDNQDVIIDLIIQQELNETLTQYPQMTEEQKTQIMNVLKEEVKNKASSELNGLTQSIKDAYKSKLGILANLSNRTILILLVVIFILIFINSGLLLTTHFVEKILLELALLFALPSIIWTYILKSGVVEKIILSQLADIKSTQNKAIIQIIQKILQKISEIFHFEQYLTIALILLVSGIALLIGIRFLAKHKLQYLEEHKMEQDIKQSNESEQNN